MSDHSTAPRARFESKYRVDKESGCWVWTAARTDEGYGAFWAVGCVVLAHRFSYELHVRPIPEGLTIDHTCRNRACVNPAHLEPVTRGVNVLRGQTNAARNAAKTHCQNGHRFTPDNTRRSRSGKRECRICIRAREKAKRARKRRSG